MISVPLDDPRWIALLKACPEASPFHHPSWATFLGRCYGYSAFALLSTDSSGQAAAGLPVLEVSPPLLPRKWVSLPFTDHCPPLSRDETARTRLILELDGARRRAGVGKVAVRADLSGTNAHPYVAGVIHRLPVERDASAVFRRFKASQVRRNIRRAEREGIEVRRAVPGTEGIDIFYRLHVGTRRRHGVPVQPRRYFTQLCHELMHEGLGFVSVAYARDKPVAAAVFLTWNRTVIYKYGASDPAYWPLRPNHLLFWDAIRWSCENGYEIFDFGRTECANKGLRDFKSGWGACEEPLVYSTIADRARQPSRFRLSSALRPAIRRGPPSLCRLLGELFYRYAA